MTSKWPGQILGILVTILVLVTAFLAACGPPGSQTPSSASSPSPTSVPRPTAGDAASLRAKGAEVYQKTAGGLGCQYCHGADAKGTNLGPDVRGKSAEDVKRALTSDQMSFIRLTEEELEAVVAYIKSLESRP